MSQILVLMVAMQNKPTSNLQTWGEENQEREKHRNGQRPLNLDLVACTDREMELAKTPDEDYRCLYRSSQKEERMQPAPY